MDDVRFEDHPAFQRAALLAAAGGAALLAAGGPLPLAMAGSAAAVTLAASAPWRWRILAACACAAGACAWQLAPRPWSAPACGVMLALLFAAVRADGLKREEAAPLASAAVALAALAGSAVLWAASALLPDLTAALATAVPSSIAAGLSGAVLGIWTAFASVPLHLRIRRDPAGLEEAARSELRA